jgi:glutamate synthase (NADPH/NADH) large chain
LNTRIGNLQNILGEDLFNKKSYLLESPVLSNAQFKKLFEVLNDEYREIDCTFDAERFRN